MIHTIQNGHVVWNLECEEYKESSCIILIAQHRCKRISNVFVRFVAVKEVRWDKTGTKPD
jgi:hypothetical protein